MHHIGTQYTLKGERKSKDREQFLCLNFSCSKIIILLHIYVTYESNYKLSPKISVE